MKMLKCFYVAFLMLLHHFAEGHNCGIVDEKSEFICPSLCAGSECTSNVMQGYNEADMTSTVRGCVGDGLFRETSKGLGKYEEFHVIYSAPKNSKITKIYLTIKDASIQLSHSLSSNITPIYNFVLLSSSKATWIVSYEKTNASYVFHTYSSSLVRDSLTGKKIETKVVRDFAITTSTGRLYWPIQIKDNFDDTFGLESSLTTMVDLNAANSLQLSVGNALQQDYEPQRCEVPDSDEILLNGDKSRIKASLLTFLPVVQSCSGEDSWNQKTELFIVDVSNNIINSTIKLHLIGAAFLEQNSTVVVALRSSVPVIWEPVEPTEKSSLTNFIFLVSSNNTVKFGTPWSSRKSVEYSNLLNTPDANQMLKSLRSSFDYQIQSYSKLNGDPSSVEIYLVDKGQLAGDKDRPRPHEDFFLKLHGDMSISSSAGARLFIACKTLETFKLKSSEIKVGNGNCSWNYTADGVMYSNLTQCGLKRYSQIEFDIMVSARGLSRPIIFRIKSEPSAMTAYTDIRRTNPIEKLQVVTANQNTFFTRKFGIMSKVDHCYLSQNGSNLLDIIRNNCPVNKYTSFLVHSQTQPSGRTGFTLSFAPLLESSLVGQVDLVCLISKCLEPHRDLTWRSILPQCPLESAVVCDPSKNSGSDHPEMLTIPFFVGPVQTSTVASTFGVTTPLTTASSVLRTTTSSETSDEFKVATLILGLLLGLTVLLMLAFIFYKVLKCPIMKMCYRKRRLKEELRLYNAARDHGDCIEIRTEQSSSLMPRSLAPAYDAYQKRLRLQRTTMDSYEQLDISNPEQCTIEDDDERTLIITSTRTKEDSTSSSSSSTSTDSGVAETKSLDESCDDSLMKETHLDDRSSLSIRESSRNQ